MRVNYVGASEKQWGRAQKRRGAELAYEKEEIQFAEAVAAIMQENGWDIMLDCEWGFCEVSDHEEFRDFMEDWKEAKKAVKAATRKANATQQPAPETADDNQAAAMTAQEAANDEPETDTHGMIHVALVDTATPVNQTEDSAEAEQPTPQEDAASEAGTGMTLTLTPGQAKVLLDALCVYDRETRTRIKRCAASDALPTEQLLLDSYKRDRAIGAELRAPLYRMAFMTPAV